MKDPDARPPLNGLMYRTIAQNRFQKVGCLASQVRVGGRLCRRDERKVLTMLLHNSRTSSHICQHVYTRIHTHGAKAEAVCGCSMSYPLPKNTMKAFWALLRLWAIVLRPFAQ